MWFNIIAINLNKSLCCFEAVRIEQKCHLMDSEKRTLAFTLDLCIPQGGPARQEWASVTHNRGSYTCAHLCSLHLCPACPAPDEGWMSCLGFQLGRSRTKPQDMPAPSNEQAKVTMQNCECKNIPQSHIAWPPYPSHMAWLLGCTLQWCYFWEWQEEERKDQHFKIFILGQHCGSGLAGFPAKPEDFWDPQHGRRKWIVQDALWPP